MKDNKDNAPPDRIWITNYVLKQLTDDVQITDDKSLSNSEDIEYILKSTADKKLDEYVKLSDRILHDIDKAKDKRMQEILQPIRDVIHYKTAKFVEGSENYLPAIVLSEIVLQAIEKTLKLADKHGN